MTAPVDEIDVGRESQRRPPWQNWSRGRRRVVAAVLALVVVAGGVVWLMGRQQPEPPAAVAPSPIAIAPGANVIEELPPDTSKCPATATCRYDDTIDAGAQSAFAEAFGSAGYIGRQTVTDANTNQVYWQYLRFATGTLVTVTLTQQAVSEVGVLPVPRDTPSDSERRSGSVTLTAVRNGYVITANAAGLPGQLLPVPSVQQWLRTVPTP